MTEVKARANVRPCPICGGRNVAPDPKIPSFFVCLDCAKRRASATA